MAVQSTYTEDLTIGYAGMLAAADRNEVLSMVQNEASNEIAFGLAVQFDASGNDQDAAELNAITDNVAGILLHSHRHAKDSGLGATGVKPGEVINVLTKGRVLVVCEDGCVPGDRLHIRALAGTAGALLSAQDGVNTIDATAQGRWLTTATAGNLAWLEVDFTNA